jgi:uncharacterized membrane protein YdjX (TVP38/TMEM64 family)
MELFNKRNIALIFSCAFIGFLVWSSVQFQQNFAKFIPALKNLTDQNEFLSIAIFVGIAAITTMLSSFVRIVPAPLGILLWGSSETALYMLFGWLIGDALSYFIGYGAINPTIKNFLPMEKVAYYREKIPPHAELKLVAFFIFAVPAEVANYVLGAIRYDFMKYFIVTIFSEFFYAAITAFTARALIQSNFIYFIGAIVFLSLLFSYSFYIFDRRLKKKK